MELTQLIKQPELMNKETLYDLRKIVAQYPFYQTARILMLQNLYLLHDTSFDEELRRAAVYITDRKVIFNMIEAAHYQLKSQKTHSSNEADAAKNESRTTTLIDNFLESLPEDDNEQRKSKKRKPTPADAAIDYVSYLLETENEKQETTETDVPHMKGQNLIDDFINKEGGKITLKDNPEYLPQQEYNETENEENESEEGYFTETLAKIYIKQGRFDKALEIIRRLNLNYPKKNAYFADQIRFLEKLIINNEAK